MDGLILIVEDDAALRRLFSDVLADEGFEVQQACDGLEALEFICEERPDLVILDLNMPRMGGVGLVDALDARDLKTFPLLVVSASRAAIALRPRVDGVLQKPVDLDVFVRCVLQVLQLA